MVPLERKFDSDQLLTNDLSSIMTSLGDKGSQSKFVTLQGKKRKIKVIDLWNEKCFDLPYQFFSKQDISLKADC